MHKQDFFSTGDLSDTENVLRQHFFSIGPHVLGVSVRSTGYVSRSLPFCDGTLIHCHPSVNTNGSTCARFSKEKRDQQLLEVGRYQSATAKFGVVGVTLTPIHPITTRTGMVLFTALSFVLRTTYSY